MLLAEVLKELCEGASRFFDDGAVTVMGVDDAGLMHPLAAPAFPLAYRSALEGIPVGPYVGSCGSAIYGNQMVEVEDIETDRRWSLFRNLALPLGFQACTSWPIRDECGAAVGAMAVYLKDKRLLGEKEREAASELIHLCELAIAWQTRISHREKRATIDGLTGLPNRRAFDEALAQLRCELPGSWALLVMDVDNLKIINDTFGHDAGDALLRETGARLARTLSYDTTFRTGGDEFTTILQDQDCLFDLNATASRILEAANAPVRHDGNMFLPRMTIGGAVLTPQDVRPESVRRNADFALYHAKETQRGEFVRYWPGIATRMKQRQDSVREVLQALEEERITAHYQPLVRLESYEIVGFEALCRMTSTSGEIIPASMFHDAFADARVAARLTDCMLATVAQDIRDWLDAGLPIQHVSVNVTSTDFYLGDLKQRIRAVFAGQKVPLRHLVIEVTEEAYIGQRDDVVASGIRELQLDGGLVALDDFGTGFAALTHLLNVPVDIIKIDQSFTRDLAPGHPSMAILRGLLQIARDLKIQVVVEGVETMNHARILRELGARVGQGYAFSRPVDRNAATQLLRDHGQYAPGARPLRAFLAPSHLRRPQQKV
ncbi:MAG: sensor domain-containing phosphodiesterase [Sphingomonadales bacterium]|nr:sensor domain-containing phosphodiesterase [Sphingomonadales bacterium]MDE2170269.1 sensor domain-containing phosphodiesterase [Sphingomonadales bacterium]